jgi:hypothetical protein
MNMYQNMTNGTVIQVIWTTDRYATYTIETFPSYKPVVAQCGLAVLQCFDSEWYLIYKKRPSHVS